MGQRYHCCPSNSASTMKTSTKMMKRLPLVSTPTSAAELLLCSLAMLCMPSSRRTTFLLLSGHMKYSKLASRFVILLLSPSLPLPPLTLSLSISLSLSLPLPHPQPFLLSLSLPPSLSFSH